MELSNKQSLTLVISGYVLVTLMSVGKRKAVVVKKDRQGKITSKVSVPVTQAAIIFYASVTYLNFAAQIAGVSRRQRSYQTLMRSI